MKVSEDMISKLSEQELEELKSTLASTQALILPLPHEVSLITHNWIRVGLDTVMCFDNEKAKLMKDELIKMEIIEENPRIRYLLDRIETKTKENAMQYTIDEQLRVINLLYFKLKSLDKSIEGIQEFINEIIKLKAQAEDELKNIKNRHSEEINPLLEKYQKYENELIRLKSEIATRNKISKTEITHIDLNLE
jgi:hypothetical protein